MDKISEKKKVNDFWMVSNKINNYMIKYEEPIKYDFMAGMSY